jgi:UDP-N-acetylmuramate--alanine ligase
MEQFSHVFHIGIGGIGVSAIAHYLHEHGVKISGSDIHTFSRELLPPGGIYWEGHDASHITQDIDAIIYSPAVSEKNPERVRAKELGIPEYSYPEALGMISKQFTTIAVSGTHGKSTTTALLGELFEAASFDPTVIVGAVVPEWKRNYRNGKSDIFIVEACEYRSHMLNISPKTIVLTNLELDHPDYFRDIEHVQEEFSTYIERLSPDDLLIANGDDIHISVIFYRIKADVVRFGMSGAYLDLRATIKQSDQHGQEIALIWRGEALGSFHTLLPGKYNVMNILAACATLLAYRGNIQTIEDVLGRFLGVGRRFETLGKNGTGSTVILDYAHHPTALHAVVEATTDRYPGKTILTIFRPHHQERTKKLFKEFVAVGKHIRHLILLEIYDVPGRDSEDRISSNDLIKSMKQENPNADVQYAADFSAVKKILETYSPSPDILLVVGAGDTDALAHELMQI